MRVRGVKIESRGKLGNDEKVKFVGTMKTVRWGEKTCGSQDICKCSKCPPLSSLSISHLLSMGNQTGKKKETENESESERFFGHLHIYLGAYKLYISISHFFLGRKLYFDR